MSSCTYASPKPCFLIKITCPRCGAQMIADPFASIPRTFGGELRPRWLCPRCGYVMQER